MTNAKMTNCKLKKNQNNKRCILLRSIRNKPKSQLSWKEAKAKYPFLKSYGNADKDKYANIKDCRPFNKKKHAVYTTEEYEFEGGGNMVYVTPNEYNAFKKIAYGRKMGLPPIETHKELKADKLTGDEMRAGLQLWEKSQKGGIRIQVGEPIWLTKRLKADIKSGDNAMVREFSLRHGSG